MNCSVADCPAEADGAIRARNLEPPTALALLTLHSAAIVTTEGTAPLKRRQAADGLWPAVGDGPGPNFWATAMAISTLSILEANSAAYTDSVEALILSRPMEASWLVGLKFRFLDRHVQFDPRKYGWPWVPETVSWIAPTAICAPRSFSFWDCVRAPITCSVPAR